MNRSPWTTSTAPSPALVWAALVTVYVVWGSTYLAIRIAVETLPPFLMAGIRFVVAGAVLAAICVARDRSGVRWPTRRETLDLAIVGGCLLLGGNGLVAWGEQTLPSGIAALLVATTPIWMVIVAWLAFRERASRVVLLGVLLGLAGVAILAAPGAGGGEVGGPGLLALLAAPVFWAIGSVYGARHESAISPALLGTAVEMFLGGILLSIAAVVAGEASAVREASVASIGATAYLIVVGSLVGYTAYSWLLRNAPLPLVSTYAYVNPIVAVALGALLIGETIEPRTLVAGAVIIVSVALIITARGRAARRDAETAEAAPPAMPESADRQAA